jgi:hypothetical protein
VKWVRSTEMQPLFQGNQAVVWHEDVLRSSAGNDAGLAYTVPFAGVETGPVAPVRCRSTVWTRLSC